MPHSARSATPSRQRYAEHMHGSTPLCGTRNQGTPARGRVRGDFADERRTPQPERARSASREASLKRIFSSESVLDCMRGTPKRSVLRLRGDGHDIAHKAKTSE